MANFDLYKNSFSAFNDLNTALKNAAVKNKLQTGSLIILLALNCCIDLSFFVKAEYIEELINFGFAERFNNSFVITGKGAILAKSLERFV